jgi:uncharacterized protein YecE (DUF72 family)
LKYTGAEAIRPFSLVRAAWSRLEGGMGEIYIGTSGWSYPRGDGAWKGIFYPEGKVDELPYYSRYFNTVEVNSSFYRVPAQSVTARWASVTPGNFRFAVKLYQKFTHPKMFAESSGKSEPAGADDVERFKSAIAPIAQSGKLGCLLAQFPPSFTNSAESREHLSWTLESFSPMVMAVELRHRSWSDDRSTWDVLDRHGAAWVQIDEPKYPFSISQDMSARGTLYYARFHGRNHEKWWARGAGEERYNYLYSAEEVGGFAGVAGKSAMSAGKSFIYFNNHYRGKAIVNAIMLLNMLKITVGERLPETMTEEYPVLKQLLNNKHKK